MNFEFFGNKVLLSPGQLGAINNKLDRLLVPRRSSLKGRSVSSPRHMVGTQDRDAEEDTEEEEDFSRVEDEMMSIFRKITGPLRRARQRKYSAEKLETEIATIK